MLISFSVFKTHESLFRAVTLQLIMKLNVSFWLCDGKNLEQRHLQSSVWVQNESLLWGDFPADETLFFLLMKEFFMKPDRLTESTWKNRRWNPVNAPNPHLSVCLHVGLKLFCRVSSHVSISCVWRRLLITRLRRRLSVWLIIYSLYTMRRSIRTGSKHVRLTTSFNFKMDESRKNKHPSSSDRFSLCTGSISTFIHL